MTVRGDLAHQLATDRFFTAATAGPPRDDQKDLVTELQGAIVNLAALIEAKIPEGRNKSLSLTHLEEVQMRANRAVFQP